MNTKPVIRGFFLYSHLSLRERLKSAFVGRINPSRKRSTRTVMEEQKRKLDLRIRNVTLSVALLRSSTMMSSRQKRESVVTRHVIIDQNEAENTDGSAVLEDLHAHITALEAELNGLHFERERTQ